MLTAHVEDTDRIIGLELGSGQADL